MKKTRITICLAVAVAAFAAGCHTNMVDKGAFKSALNNYYNGRQACLWGHAIKFPAQADTSNDEQTKGFDALTDAGLLTRTPGEKSRFLIGSKQVNNYDLSDKGRSDWTPDQTQPGYGNFCFGAPEVSSIDSYSPSDNSNATQYTVAYHFQVKMPDWAKTNEMQTAFPRATGAINGAAATATLDKTTVMVGRCSERLARRQQRWRRGPSPGQAGENMTGGGGYPPTPGVVQQVPKISRLRRT